MDKAKPFDIPKQEVMHPVDRDHQFRLIVITHSR